MRAVAEAETVHRGVRAWRWLIAGAVLLAYAGLWQATFQFDDYRVIVADPAARSWAGWWADLGHGLRPLLKLGYTLSAQLGGGGAWAYALINLTLHATNALLLLRLGQRLFAVCGLPPAAALRSAALAALIWALHPLQTESVSYFSGRSGSQMACFALLSLLAYDRYLQSGRRRHAALALLAWIAALASKETAAVLPLVLLAWDALVRPQVPLRARLAGLAPYAAVLGLLIPLALMASNYRGFLDTSLATRTLLENGLNQIGALVWLLRGAALLRAPNLDPDLPAVDAVQGATLRAAALLIALLAAALVLRRHRWPSFCAAWALLWLLPTNSLLPRLDLANDRQLLLPLAAGAWSAGWLLDHLLRRWPRAAALPTLALLTGLGLASAARTADYRSELRLWQATAAQSPNKARVENNLGVALWQEAGDTDAATQRFRRALALDPGYRPARDNLLRLTGELPPMPMSGPADDFRKP